MDHIGILYVICTYIVYIHMKNQNSEIYYKGAGGRYTTISNYIY